MTGAEQKLRENKYLVLKWEDITSYLCAIDQQRLKEMCDCITANRHYRKKKDNTYVVVNEDEPYAEDVWMLVRNGQSIKEALPELAKEWTKANGYVELAEDQTLPAHEGQLLSREYRFGYKDAQQDMRKIIDGKAFRKVKLEEKDGS